MVKRMSSIAAAAVLPMAMLLPAGPANAAPASAAAGIPWSAAHQSASASGTYSVIWAGFVTHHVNGTLTVTDGSCYRVEVFTTLGTVINAGERCGAGSVAVSAYPFSLPTRPFGAGARVCRVVAGTVTGCGPSATV